MHRDTENFQSMTSFPQTAFDGRLKGSTETVPQARNVYSLPSPFYFLYPN